MAARSDDTSQPDQRIVITGLGAISPAGDCPQSLWQAVLRGVSPAVFFADPAVPGSPTIPACVVSRLTVNPRGLRQINKMDRCVQLALAAAGQAFDDARMPVGLADPARLGVIVGSSRGTVHKVAEVFELLHAGARLPPSAGIHGNPSTLSGTLSSAFGAAGPCVTVSATCASGAYAITLAAQQIAAGDADVMLAGGAEAPLQDAVIRQLLSYGILGTHADPARACRPFDVSRNGTVLGEGAAFLVLESLESARRRGAVVHAELAGWAIASDHFHSAAPPEDGEGLFRVMSRAVARARLRPGQIDHVNTHGTGTKLNDPAEVKALRRLLGERLAAVPCCSTKPVTGHALGGSAALEAVICVLALQHQSIPPTANCEQLDPDCRMDLVRGSPRPARLECVLSGSLGFWGKNAALVFARMN